MARSVTCGGLGHLCWCGWSTRVDVPLCVSVFVCVFVCLVRLPPATFVYLVSLSVTYSRSLCRNT